MVVDDDAVVELEAAALEEVDVGLTPTPTTARNASIMRPEAVRTPVSMSGRSR